MLISVLNCCPPNAIGPLSTNADDNNANSNNNKTSSNPIQLNLMNFNGMDHSRTAHYLVTNAAQCLMTKSLARWWRGRWGPPNGKHQFVSLSNDKNDEPNHCRLTRNPHALRHILMNLNWNDQNIDKPIPSNECAIGTARSWLKSFRRISFLSSTTFRRIAPRCSNGVAAVRRLSIGLFAWSPLIILNSNHLNCYFVWLFVRRTTAQLFYCLIDDDDKDKDDALL